MILIRYGFALFIVESIILIFIGLRDDFSKNINENMWICKNVLLVLLWFVFFFIPHGFFEIVMIIS